MKLENQILGATINTSSQMHADIADEIQRNKIGSTALAMALLCIVNFMVYFPSIGGFFLADDFTHIRYLYDVFHGKPALLLTNFYSNWMQTAGTEFYRPLTTLSLALDYLIWKNNAMGFHLSNLFFQVASTILFYFLVQRLVFTIVRPQAKLLAFVSAMFFAVYPLHPEVVSWVIGRVDSLATMFYLAAFLLFLKHEQDSFEKYPSARLAVLWLSLTCYCCALLSKEIAITLPLAIWLWLVICAPSDNKSLSKMLRALKTTLPYWLTLAAYLAIRSVALGTLWGGYAGSLAVKLSVFKILFEQPLLAKLVFPFNDELFSPRHLLRNALHVLYALAGIVIILRLMAKRFYYLPGREIIYGILWLILCVVPAYQVLYLTPTLQGSRMIYLASLPLSFLFSLLLMPILNKDLPSNPRTKFLTIASSSLCLLVLLVFARTAYLNNLPWRRAGDELKELRQSLLDKATIAGSQKKLVLFNMPGHFKGAHMLCNGYMLNLLCSKEVSGCDFPSKIITFEHPFFSDPDLFNMTRLQRMLVNKDRYVFVGWQRFLPSAKNSGSNSMCGCLKDINIDNTTQPSTKLTQKTSCIDANVFQSIDFKMPPLLTVGSGLFELVVKASGLSKDDNQKGYSLQVHWFSADDTAIRKDGSLALPLVIDNDTHSYLFNFREHISWLLCNHVDRLKICATPGKYKLEIIKARFRNPANVIPQFDLYRDTSRFEDAAGVYHLSPKQVITFQYDASQVTGAQSIAYEISKPNVWFEHQDKTLNANHFSSDVTLLRKIGIVRGDFEVHGSDLGLDYFETHLAAVDKQGHMVGLMSDPVYAQVGF